MDAGCRGLRAGACYRRCRVGCAVHCIEARVQLRAYPLVVLQILQNVEPARTSVRQKAFQAARTAIHSQPHAA